jgi:hypothetical protein
LDIESQFSIEFGQPLEIDRSRFPVFGDAAPDLKLLRSLTIPLVDPSPLFVTVIAELPDQKQVQCQFFRQATIGELKTLLCPEHPLHTVDVFMRGAKLPDNDNLMDFTGHDRLEFRLVDRYLFRIGAERKTLELARNEQTFDGVIRRLGLSPDVMFFRNGTLLDELGPPHLGTIEIRRRPVADRVTLVWRIRCVSMSDFSGFDLSFTDCISSRDVAFSLDGEATVDDLIEYFTGATGVLFPPFALFSGNTPLDDRSVKLADIKGQTFSVQMPADLSCKHLRVRQPVGDITSEFIVVSPANLTMAEVRAHLAGRYELRDPFTLAQSGIVLCDSDEFDIATQSLVWVIE